MLVLTIAAAVFIGLALGVLGGGGSILTVPILVYLAGVDAKQAIAMSLFVVGVTSAIGAISHARAGRVRWRTGLVFGAAGMAGAYGGGRLAEFIPGVWLLVGFGLMMIATAVAMIRGRRTRGGAEAPKVHGEMPVGKVIAEGVVVGLVTGLVGAGGGFLVVPALALLGGLPMGVAVGTSLVVIAMKSFAGLAGYLASVEINWPLALAVTGAAVVGGVIGGRLAGRIPEGVLRKGFGWFVIVMGGFLLVQQLPSQVWSALADHPVAWIIPVAVAAAAALTFVGYRRHRAQQRKRDEIDRVDVAS
ncbi:putative permease [Saccharomonospora marina XMU15]|uniref:Probable membrane transporter protein n=1 Tax=Saccharomonospora marina XMU15 TaxID=882083 RepID=H5X0Q3_9PSEU|nr:sulfite exporter TauE/SafE family protein [Saccharomonospora marina]EHR50849.1 putative permease [Saccharomonospora marina XMU15]